MDPYGFSAKSRLSRQCGHHRFGLCGQQSGALLRGGLQVWALTGCVPSGTSEPGSPTSTYIPSSRGRLAHAGRGRAVCRTHDLGRFGRGRMPDHLRAPPDSSGTGPAYRGEHHAGDLRCLAAAVHLNHHLPSAHRGMLLPILAGSTVGGFLPGLFSRRETGQPPFQVHIPKVVGGVSPCVGARVALLQVRPGDSRVSTQAAEMSKPWRTYRAVNIALVNELKMLWPEDGVVSLESSRPPRQPFGFQPLSRPAWGPLHPSSFYLPGRPGNMIFHPVYRAGRDINTRALFRGARG